MKTPSAESIRRPSMETEGRKTSAPPDVDIRDRIATRSARVEERFPRAHDLEAQILGAMRPHLSGVASILSGTHDPERFREMLRGERRSLPLYDITRLATSDRPEAGAAMDALLDVLARARGKSVVPAAAPGASLLHALADVSESENALTGGIVRAMDDNVLDDIERADAIEKLRRLRACTAVLETALAVVPRVEGWKEQGRR